GCTGPRLRAAGVRTVVDAASLAGVGLLEVVSDIPRIYREYRKLLAAAAVERPDVAILTDSPDFHLRVARKLHRQGVMVVYLVAPQAWAWRKGRVKQMRRDISRLLCIFPFEEEFFRREGVNAAYIGHPLAGLVRPSLTRDEFFRKHRLAAGRPLISVLPGSRRGEAARHLPALLDAAGRLYRERAVNLVLPASSTTGAAFFEERVVGSPVRVFEGESWDAMAHSDVALVASGTVTVEAALLNTPMVTFYKVTPLSWLAGKFLVRVPFYSMVNLIAGRAVVPELMQSRMTGEAIACEARRLLTHEAARSEMKAGLAEVREKLSGGPHREPRAPGIQTAPQRAAAIIQDILEGQLSHVS
ncbi:MAG TPA: lipid-A-disaccharide synthase, partial [Candidatus Solibacter sp.]|nr:lipid-A-disaccharide synthase [Candidatus Solibacter sp.]